MRVKICGITNLVDAQAAVSFGADALGFILASESPRCISAETASSIIKQLPPFVTTIGVITSGDASEIHRLIHGIGLHLIQFHGDFPDATLRRFSHRAIQVLRVKDENTLATVSDVPRRALLLDTYHEQQAGGSGIAFNWQIAKKAASLGNVILAGGLRPDNVQEAIRQAKPYGVDVSSGIEAEKGKKDLVKLQEFIYLAKEAAAKMMEGSVAASK